MNANHLDRDAFQEMCRRYFGVTGDVVDAAFVFYQAATTSPIAPTPDDVEWAQFKLLNHRVVGQVGIDISCGKCQNYYNCKKAGRCQLSR